MRKAPTDAERKLWNKLSRNQTGYRFRRQHPMGKQFIADFICLEKKLIIELDGSQHLEIRKKHDGRRTDFLEYEGYRVLRFWNNEVLQNMHAVLESITAALNTPHASTFASGSISAAPPQEGSRRTHAQTH
jgi:very-short-patch-repair endonuclease